MNFPENGKIKIRSLAERDASSLPLFHGIIKDISVLGFDEKPYWEHSTDSLTIYTKNVQSNKPVVFKILID